MPNTAFWNWLGGFFDGEGTIGHQPNKPTVGLYQKDRSVLEMVQAEVGGNILNMGHCYKLSWDGHKAAVFLRDLFPYLRHPARVEKALAVLGEYFEHDYVQVKTRWYRLPRKLRRGEEWYYKHSTIHIRKRGGAVPMSSGGSKS